MFFSIACASYAWAVSTSSSKEPMNVFSPSTWISRRRLPPQRTPMKLVEVPPPLPARAVAQRSPRGAAAMRDIADAAASEEISSSSSSSSSSLSLSSEEEDEEEEEEEEDDDKVEGDSSS